MSVCCRLTVGILPANSWPTVYRQTFRGAVLHFLPAIKHVKVFLRCIVSKHCDVMIPVFVVHLTAWNQKFSKVTCDKFKKLPIAELP